MKAIKLSVIICLLSLIPLCSFSQLGTVLSYSKIGATNSILKNELESGDSFQSMAAIGDINGDGIDDIAVGALGDDDGGSNRGAVYILFMDFNDSIKSFQKISSTKGSFTGSIKDNEGFGSSVTGIGDLDGDGVKDIAVGQMYDNDGGSWNGSVWILFLNIDGTVKNHQKISDTEGGFTGTLSGTPGFGGSVENLGDLNGDGIVDLAVGSARHNEGGAQTGKLWILFLDSNGTVQSHNSIGANTANFGSELSSGDLFGMVSNIGDLNGDGVTDIAVSARGDDDGGSDRGAFYIIFLNTNGSVKSYQKISSTQGGFTDLIKNGNEFGSNVTNLGDIDGDNLPDMAVGARKDDDGGNNRGAVWILYLNADGTVKYQEKLSSTKGSFSGDLDDDDQFGAQIGLLRSGKLMVAAPYDDDIYNDVGAVWMLNLYSCVGTIISKESSLCIGASISLKAKGFGDYLWSTGQTTDSILVTPDSTTTYQLIVTDTANGCIDTTSITMIVKPLPVVSISIDNNTLCEGESKTIQASGATNYVWTPTTGLNTSSGANVIASPTVTTTYTVIGSSPGEGCVDLEQITINVIPKPTLVVSTNEDSICSGNSTTLSATGSTGSYSWLPANSLDKTSGDTVVASPLTSTSYTVTASDTNNCSAQATVNISVYNDFMSISPTNPTICTGDTVSLTAVNGSSYVWNTGDTTSLITVSLDSSSNYSAVISNAKGCIDTATVSVNVLPSLSIALTSQDQYICEGGFTNITASGAVSYSWTPTLSLNDSVGSTVNASPDSTTTYTVYGVSGQGCSDTAQVTLIVYPNPNLSLNSSGGSNICQNSPTTLQATGANSYSWSPATGLSSTSGSVVSAEPSGNTTYTVTGTSIYGCSNSTSIALTVNSSSFDISFTQNTQLLTQAPFAIQFNNTTTNMQDYNFTWAFGDGTSLNSNNTVVFHEYPYNGLYDITLIATHKVTGCQDTLHKPGWIYCTGGISCPHTALINETGPINACKGDTVQLSSNTHPDYIYQWSLNNVPISGDTNSTIIANQSGSYNVTIFNNSCPKVSSAVMVNLNASPAKPTIIPQGALTFCAGGSVTLVSEDDYAKYNWSNGDTTKSITVSQSGDYLLTVENINGCSNVSDTFRLFNTLIPAPDICLVGVDSVTNKLMVVWEKQVNSAIDSFLIYRESNQANVYKPVGAVAYDEMSTFIDNSSNPFQQAYRYKIAIKDSCGNTTLLSDLHKSIHLTINQGIGQSWNLIWSHYEGFNFASYSIYRSDAGTWQLLTTIANNLNSYTDLNAPNSEVYYMIEAVRPNGCSPAKSFSSSLSNIVLADPLGIDGGGKQTAFVVFPNPSASGEFTLQADAEVIYKIYDILGKVIDATSAMKNKHLIQLDNTTKGIYLLEIETKDNIKSFKRIIIN